MTSQEKYLNKSYGRLTVIEYISGIRTRRIRIRARVKAICICGEVIFVDIERLISGKTKSCGCWRREQTTTANTTHGMRHTPENRIYQGMKSRCLNPSNPGWDNWGGRGIKIAERWLGEHGFINFLADIGPRPSPKHSLDRYPNPNGNYEPGNVRWATQQEQMRNTRKNHLVSFQDKTLCLAAWEEETGIPQATIRARLGRLGWSIERALTTPV